VDALGVARIVVGVHAAHDANAVGDGDHPYPERLQHEGNGKGHVPVCLRIAKALPRVGGRRAEHRLGGSGDARARVLVLVRKRWRIAEH